MKQFSRTIVLAAALMGAAGATLSVAFPEAAQAKDDDDHFPKLAPFTGTRFPETGGVEMLIDGAWYRLVKLNETTEADLLKFAQENFGRRWQKRITEDLAEILIRMNQPQVDTVDLELIDIAGGETVTKLAVPMTEANRRAAWMHANGKPKTESSQPVAPTTVERVSRTHTDDGDPRYAHIGDAVAGTNSDRSLSAAEAHRDLDQLEWLVQNEFSYRDLRGVDVERAFDTLRASIDGRVDRNTFSIGVVKLLALFGDGHSRANVSFSRTLTPGFLPFLVEDAAEGFIALRDDRNGFVDDEHPLITAIDGRPLSDWFTVAGEYVADGSPQFERRGSMRALRHINQMRRELGLAESGTIEVELASLDRKKTTTIEVRVADRKPIYGTWPKTESRRLDGELGYLRIDRMNSRAAVDASRWMTDFADTRGLIVDVRGNGGGTREALRALAPYLLDDAHVANVGAYRLHDGDDPSDPNGHLDNRFLYPEAWSGWNDGARKSIAESAAAFTPEWAPPTGEFSDWHYMVVTPGEARYTKPVIVLIDSGCFSATDIFVGGLEGLPQVMLMGTATGGGSGRSRRSTLAHSGIEVKFSSMASFRPDGSLYDTRGIAPDVEVRPAATDFIGVSDSILDAAVERLAR